LRGLAHNHLRVLRGGSFNNNEHNARCAYRNRNNPNNYFNNNGVRVVVVVHAFPAAGMVRWESFSFRNEA